MARKAILLANVQRALEIRLAAEREKLSRYESTSTIGAYTQGRIDELLLLVTVFDMAEQDTTGPIYERHD